MADLGEAYHPSGKGAAALLPMAVVAGGVAGAVAGPYTSFVAYLYATATVQITGFKKFKGWGILLVFVWILGAGLAGMLVGLVAGGVGRALRCRTGTTAPTAALSFLLAAVGLYAYYDVWALRTMGEEGLRALPPDGIWTQLQAHLADRATSGKVMAYGTYLLEAAVYWAGVSLGLDQLLDRPYCEGCGRWTTRHDAAAAFGLLDEASLEELAARLRAGDLGVLDELGPPDPKEKEALVADLDVCEGCEASRYLTLRTDANPTFQEKELDGMEAIQQVRRLTSAKGMAKTLRKGAEEEYARREVVKQLRVDAATAGRLLPDR